jgi:hypothetical protein
MNVECTQELISAVKISWREISSKDCCVFQIWKALGRRDQNGKYTGEENQAP